LFPKKGKEKVGKSLSAGRKSLVPRSLSPKKTKFKGSRTKGRGRNSKGKKTHKKEDSGPKAVGKGEKKGK